MDSYFKFTEKGELIFVNEAARKFTYITPAYDERAETLLPTLEDLFDFIEHRYKTAKWVFYPVKNLPVKRLRNHESD